MALDEKRFVESENAFLFQLRVEQSKFNEYLFLLFYICIAYYVQMIKWVVKFNFLLFLESALSVARARTHINKHKTLIRLAQMLIWTIILRDKACINNAVCVPRSAYPGTG